MADRDPDAEVGEASDQFETARDLGRDGHHGQALDQRLDLGPRHIGGIEQQGRIVSALLGLRDERPLDVEPEWLRAVRGRASEPRARAVGPAVKHGKWVRHPGRQERRHALAEQGPSHPVELLAVAHRVESAPAMDVDVDEAGREVGELGGLARIAVAVEVHAGDPVVLQREASDGHPIIEHEAPAKLRSRHPFISTAVSTSKETSSAYRSAG
jgi:hypothetical protein